MSPRLGNVTQAQLERTLRALQRADLPIQRIILRVDGYVIEIAGSAITPGDQQQSAWPTPVL